MRQSRLAFVVLSAAALTAAGCGNSALSYSDFIDQANKICKEGNDAVANAKSAKEAADIIEKKYLPRFEKLDAPDKLKPSKDRFVKDTKEQFAAIRSGDDAQLQKLSDDSDEAASKMGTKECITQSG